MASSRCRCAVLCPYSLTPAEASPCLRRRQFRSQNPPSPPPQAPKSSRSVMTAVTLSSSSPASAAAPRTVLGACPHDCPDSCSIVTTVQDGVATRVQGNAAHPHTAGVLCTKVSRYTQRSYHAERILQPLRRNGPKGTGQFVPVSWDEALRDIAARLQSIAARNPEAIVPYSYAGTMGLVQGESMAARFFNRLGAPSAPVRAPRRSRRHWAGRWGCVWSTSRSRRSS